MSACAQCTIKVTLSSSDVLIVDFLLLHRELNNLKALQDAIKNVELFFPLVGVLELLNCTLKVAEQEIILSPFFKGIQDMYFNQLLGNKDSFF